MASTSLPPGFRFHPTDVELVKYYLKRKVMGKKLASNVIAEVDVYKNEPWDLPDKSYLPSRDLKWYFYCPREKKYSSGLRINRATECGYWKTTGKDRPVLYNAKTVGMIKTLIYHLGRAPKGDRTDWVMHEYRLDDKDLADGGVVQDVFVLCMIFKKEGPGPRNGAQYGAPFKEDDWSDDEENNGVGKALSESQPAPVQLLPSQSDSAVTTGPVSESICIASTSDCRRLEILPSVEKLLPVAANNYSSSFDLSQIQEDGDFLSMQDLVQEDHDPEPTEKNENKQLNNSNQDKDVVPACTDEGDIFEDLGDLWSWFGRNENGTHFAGDGDAADYSMDQIWAATSAADPGAFILLSDLDTPLSGSGPSNAP